MILEKSKEKDENNLKSRKGDKVLVRYEGGLYDITAFLEDHPGGKEILQQYGGQDISRLFHDPGEHMHSQFALNLLKKYRVDDDVNSGENAAHESKGKFLDLNKALIPQMWNLKISKEEYLREVHLPRHLGRPARFFESDRLEILTKTPWWFIPLFWGPILVLSGLVGGSRMLAQGYSQAVVGVVWTLGIMGWSLLEYTFHRFIFHMTDYLPEHPVALTIHFLFHGVHHFLPMDQYRLVMPPVLFGFFCTIFLAAMFAILPPAIVLTLYSGALIGYISYDMMHYFFHHGGSPPIKHIAMMKTYHMDHHYVQENLGFGVSTKVWDRVFETELPPHKELK